MSYRRPKPLNAHRPYELAACGECPRGRCDRCEFCAWVEAISRHRRPQIVVARRSATNAIGGPQTYTPRGVS